MNNTFSLLELKRACSGTTDGLVVKHLTDAYLLGIKRLAAVVGRPREVRQQRADHVVACPPQRESELTQHSWKRWTDQREVEGGYG